MSFQKALGLAIAAAALAIVALPPALADTLSADQPGAGSGPVPVARTWDGAGGDNDWMTPGNWLGGVAPQPGDDLIFQGAVQTSTENNFPAGTNFHSITIDGNGFTLAGNPVTLSLATGPAIVVDGQSANVLLHARLDSTVDVTGGDSLAIGGNLTGSDGLTKTGDGTLVLSGANTFSGGLTLSGGQEVIDSSAALPAGAGLSIGAGCTFMLGGGAALPESTGVAAVPEPGVAVALLGLAGMGVLGLAWRRRRPSRDRP